MNTIRVYSKEGLKDLYYKDVVLIQDQFGQLDIRMGMVDANVEHPVLGMGYPATKRDLNNPNIVFHIDGYQIPENSLLILVDDLKFE